MSTVETLPPTAPAQQQQQQLLPQSLQLQIKPAVDPQGAFVQDKVLKSGWLEKRTRKTKVR